MLHMRPSKNEDAQLLGEMKFKLIYGASISISNGLPYVWNLRTNSNPYDVPYTGTSVNDFNKKDRSDYFIRPIHSNFDIFAHQDSLELIWDVLDADGELKQITEKVCKYLVKGRFNWVNSEVKIIENMGKTREFLMSGNPSAKVCDAICRATVEILQFK